MGKKKGLTFYFRDKYFRDKLADDPQIETLISIADKKKKTLISISEYSLHPKKDDNF